MSGASPREAFAAAKVNLFLHVGPRAADGYHPIASLIVFADLGDRLTLERAGGSPPLCIEGPFAAGLSNGEDNLVLRAYRTWGSPGAFRFLLDKQLPLASGLGGGSADAAAALRLLNASLAEPRAPAELRRVARSLGSDVAACLASEAVVATGRGDQLRPAPDFPDLAGLLVNPGVASPTADVYRAFDERRRSETADLPALRDRYDAGELVRLVVETRNDLEGAALALQPTIGEALAVLREQPETLAARMSGSGASVFALCAGGREAGALAERLAAARPDWWVRACRLGSGPK